MRLIVGIKMQYKPKNPTISLHISPQMWQSFRESMLTAKTNNEEVIGFFFCERQQISRYQIRYFPLVWVVPSPDCYEEQLTHGLVLKQSFHLYLLKTYVEEQRLHIVHIHTHAGGETPNFSWIDDHHESHYAKFISTYSKSKIRFISGVFDRFLQQSQFRIWDRKGEFCQSVFFHNSWFENKDCLTVNNEKDLRFDRQQVFGESLQKQLGQLTVTLIGCGGIGAIFAELLGRLGVKNWLLIDPDRLETVNLNRMPAATSRMAQNRWYKVHYVKGLIKNIYPQGSHVKAIATSIENYSSQREIAQSDLIVVATDNHRSRQLSQELALKYMRPLMCLGTHIEIRDKMPRMYCRISVPPLGGGWCLMCGNIINLQQAAMEVAPNEIQHLAISAGYLEGINDPAVFWLNSICASTGVGIIQGMISGFLDLKEGLDWIYHFPSSNWLKTDVEYMTTSNCYFCANHPE